MTLCEERDDVLFGCSGGALGGDCVPWLSRRNRSFLIWGAWVRPDYLNFVVEGGSFESLLEN